MTCPIQLLMAKLGLHPVSLAPEACQVETSHDAPSQNFSKQVKKGGGLVFSNNQISFMSRRHSVRANSHTPSHYAR